MKVIFVVKTREFTLDVGAREPVIEIKQRIQQIFGIPVSSQSLSMFGLELFDGLDMEDYPIITEGCKVDLDISHNFHIFPNIENRIKIQIIVKLTSRQIVIEIDKTETIRSLKEKIHIMEGTPISRMCLFFSGIELEEDLRNLSEYGIHEFSEIMVCLKPMSRLRDEPPAKMLDIVVQAPSSLLKAACIPLTEVNDSITISDLRQILWTQKILPVDDYLFIHKQRIMRDNCSLRWHGVENGDFLYVFKGTISRQES